MRAPNPKELLNYAQAADLLSLPEGTVRYLVWLKSLPHLRLAARSVRFERAALTKWLENHRVSAQRRARRGSAR